MNEHQTKRFEHQELLDNLTVPCPPEEFTERETVAYRWVFETMDDPDNFVPQYLKKPKRFDNKADSLKCLALGLSFFNSEANAKRRFGKLKLMLPGKIGTKLEKNVATGTLKQEFGVQSNVNEEGHFTLFNYAGIEWEKHFNITTPL